MSPSDEEEEEGNEEEQERAGLLEESTTALIRRYTMQRNGRPTSIHFGPSGEIVGSGWLSEILMTNHKKCSVTLEEDSITWRFLSRKDDKVRTLFLSDIYGVVQGTQSAHPPLTPRSPGPRGGSHPLGGPPTPSPAPSQPSARPHNQADSGSSSNSKKLRKRPSSSSLSASSLSSNCFFMLYALRSQPGSVGQLVRVSFRCPTPETAETWVEQITHQMQNYGNRPRKLYVVMNPMSGNGSGSNFDKMWSKVQQMFQVANIHTDILTTQHRFHAREQIQSLELSQYDGLVAVGGDGLFNEVLNGLLIQTQNQSGVNLRRSRFVPVTPTIRIGVIPTGFNNSICRSVFGSKSPYVAAAQIMLGCSSPMDVSSVSQNNSLLLFSAGPMSYGFWSAANTFSHDFNWMGSRRYDFAALRALLSLHHFEAEIQFVPVEDPDEVLRKKEKCLSRCQKCSNFDSSLDSPSMAHEKGASVMAAYNEVDRVDTSKWKTITGQFSSVMACLHTCCGVQAPHGVSPYGHIGNGCTDLVMLTRCSAFDHAKWLLKQRRKSSSQFTLPNVHIRRVKEFRFREILQPVTLATSSRSSSDPEDTDARSIDNLISTSEPDDDEITNSRAGARLQQQQQQPQHGQSAASATAGGGAMATGAAATGADRHGSIGGGGGGGGGGNGRRVSRQESMPTQHTSQWIIDGDELPRADIEVRVHRHLVSVFARGVEPLHPDDTTGSCGSIDVENLGEPTNDQQDLI